MKRDMDLVRKILFAIEANEDATGHGWIELGNINNYSEKQVSYHVSLLYQGGLIDAIDLSNMNSFCWEPKRLTWEGQEFLEAIRKEGTWEKLKKEATNLSFAAIKMKALEIVTS